MDHKSETIRSNVLVTSNNETLLGGCNIVVFISDFAHITHWGALLYFDEGKLCLGEVQ